MRTESNEETGQVSALLSAWTQGDASARDRLLAVLYDELRSRARQLMREERRGHTIDATGLVHEAYLRLVNQSRASWQNRAQFLAVASTLMRRILVDYARARGRAKRDAAGQVALFDPAQLEARPVSPDPVDMDEAIDSLALVDALQAKIIELRFFAGLSIGETARFLEISPSTAKREWRMARAWLWRRLQADC